MFAPAGTTAIAVNDGRIPAHGDDAPIRFHIGAQTLVIDAGGREVMPGFIESQQLLVARATVGQTGLAVGLRHEGPGAIAALGAPPRKLVA